MTEPQEEIRTMVRQLFRDDQGRPILLTDGQVEIFEIISKKKYPRSHIMSHTRYGKSLDVGLAVLCRCATFPEKWAIVAGTKEKAKIIMSYINAHIFDSEYTAAKFRFESGDSAESIRRNRNKNHISFDHGKGKLAEIFICSAAEAIGFGAPNVIADEASLIDDDDWALVMRMLGDDAQNSFLLQIGNPFKRNHFLKESLDPRYHKINIDYHRGIAEGRLTEEYVEEMRQYKFFKVLYENKFPNPEDIDESGWMYLFNDNDLREAQARKVEPYGRMRLGLDVARGGRNYNVWVLRGDNYAKMLKRNLDNDLMSVVGTTIDFIKEFKIEPGNTFIDDVGVGGGVTDRMRELGYKVVAVKEGAKARDPEKYVNLKTECYAGTEGMSNWIRRGAYLEPNEGWAELLRIRYKKTSDSKTKLESKDDMRARGEESPDVADALMLTFASGKTHSFEMIDPEMVMRGGVKPY